MAKGTRHLHAKIGITWESEVEIKRIICIWHKHKGMTSI